MAQAKISRVLRRKDEMIESSHMSQTLFQISPLLAKAICRSVKACQNAASTPALKVHLRFPKKLL